MDMYERERIRIAKEQIVSKGMGDPLLIGYEQMISQHCIVALMTDLLKLTGVERILEVVAGSGYQAEILGMPAERTGKIHF